MATSQKRSLVTQVAWHGDDSKPEEKPEEFRVGTVTSLIGRRLDQGVLVQLLIDETQIRAVHEVALATSATSACKASGGAECGSHEHAEAAACKAEGETSKAACDAKADACCKSADAHCETESPTATAKAAAATGPAPLTIQVPEIVGQEVIGEWLIPNDEVLLVSFGAYTTTGGASNPDRAVVRERLAIVEADPQTLDSPSSLKAPRPRVLVNPGVDPTPVPPSASLDAVPPAPIVPPPASGSASAAPLPAPPTHPLAVAPMPEVPSRTIPQGVHADGTPAELPPLPEEVEPETPADASSEPMPSPQNRPNVNKGIESAPAPSSVPEPPKPADEAAPAKEGTVKAGFVPDFSAVPRIRPIPPPARLGGSWTPVRPISFKLPLNGWIEVEFNASIERRTRDSSCEALDGDCSTDPDLRTGDTASDADRS
jgi:hypothetical protein